MNIPISLACMAGITCSGVSEQTVYFYCRNKPHLLLPGSHHLQTEETIIDPYTVSGLVLINILNTPKKFYDLSFKGGFVIFP